jgi:hypothetical protein
MWVISAYEKDGDRLVSEHSLGDVDVAQLRRLWGRPDDDPMYESYPVTPAIADPIAEYVGEPLHLDDFDYFLEYMS